jgi:hypothetical protein
MPSGGLAEHVHRVLPPGVAAGGIPGNCYGEGHFRGWATMKRAGGAGAGSAVAERRPEGAPRTAALSTGMRRGAEGARASRGVGGDVKLVRGGCALQVKLDSHLHAGSWLAQPRSASGLRNGNGLAPCGPRCQRDARAVHFKIRTSYGLPALMPAEVCGPAIFALPPPLSHARSRSPRARHAGAWRRRVSAGALRDGPRQAWRRRDGRTATSETSCWGALGLTGTFSKCAP